MKLHVINTGFFKLDGGAMHGVVPKSLWSAWNPADDENLCSWAMRCLLIEDGDRAILIDNGIGDKQSERFFSFYHLHGEDSLAHSLDKAGFGLDQITDNFLTHLHFDHCGGGVRWQADSDKVPTLTFPRARYWSQKDHWDWAMQPNARERASFLNENLLPMQESEQLELISARGTTSVLDQAFEIMTVDGHTEKQMLPKIRYKGHTIVFVADLIPSVAHLPTAWVMGYDTRPLLTMDEKARFLEQAAAENWILFFEHDPKIECATVKQTDRGVRLNETFPLADLG